MSSKVVRTVPGLPAVLNDGNHTDALTVVDLHFHEDETVTIELSANDAAASITMGGAVLRELRNK